MLHKEWFVQSISLLGAIMVLSAYVGHQLKIKLFDPEKYFYNMMNFLAGILLTYVAVETFQLGFIFMEGVWALVSGYTAVRLYLNRKKQQIK